MVLLSYATVQEVYSRRSVQREIDRLKAELAALEQQNEELERLISYLETTEFVERESRVKLGLAKPGERVIIIPRNEGAAEVAGEGGNAESNPRKWWQYFFGRKGAPSP